MLPSEAILTSRLLSNALRLTIARYIRRCQRGLYSPSSLPKHHYLAMVNLKALDNSLDVRIASLGSMHPRSPAEASTTNPCPTCRSPGEAEDASFRGGARGFCSPGDRQVGQGFVVEASAGDLGCMLPSEAILTSHKPLSDLSIARRTKTPGSTTERCILGCPLPGVCLRA
jgi:hypothetical protein